MSNGINRPYGLQVVQSQIGNGGTQKQEFRSWKKIC